MDDLEKHKEARKRQAYERLGRIDPRCVACGEDDPRCLELHHLAGRKFGDDVVPVCRNCHRKLSDDQRDHPQPLGHDPSLLEWIGHYLIGLSDFFVLIAERFKEFGRALIEKAKILAVEETH